MAYANLGGNYVYCIRVNLDHAALLGHMRDTAINPILDADWICSEPRLVVWVRVPRSGMLEMVLHCRGVVGETINSYLPFRLGVIHTRLSNSSPVYVKFFN